MTASDVEVYEDYPLTTVIVAFVLTLSIYGLGAFIVAPMGTAVVAVYLLYCASLELMLLRKACPDCWYYGRRCGFGKGLLAARLFPKGDPQRMAEREVTIKDLVPDFLVTLGPLLVGAVLLYMAFSWRVVGLLLILVVLAFPCTGMLRGTMVCPHCKQREIGCPAQKFFREVDGDD
ncbi:MAG: hypothetical protein QGG50_04570 [Methanopyri archaeon]|mgnify:CR=1 FL=1|jgi:hypothetical protein|nr:hypothetical protein [Methanopyri archaeon]